MKVGPLDLPVSNSNQILGFVLLVVLSIFLVRMLPIPATFAKFKP
jgi:hypothetical protein